MQATVNFKIIELEYSHSTVYKTLDCYQVTSICAVATLEIKDTLLPGGYMF